MMPRLGAQPWPVSGSACVATLGGGGPLVRCLIWSSWTALFSLLTLGLVWYGWIPPRRSLAALLAAQAYYRSLAPWHWLLPAVPVIIWVVLWAGPIAWVHEWSHGALLWRFGQRRPVIRWRWYGWRGAHIAVRDRAFTRQAMLLILLTPLLVFTLGGPCPLLGRPPGLARSPAGAGVGPWARRRRRPLPVGAVAAVPRRRVGL